MERSITFEVSRSLQKEWVKTMAESNRSISSKASEIIKVLRDRSYQHTSDYILRRFIQKNFKEYVEEAVRETGIPCEDLSLNKNIPWDKKCIEAIAEKLFKNLKWDFSQVNDFAEGIQLPRQITKKQWTSYLSEHKSIHRKQIFNIALSLGMDIENTQKLLMSCGAEPYNLHDVFDLICLYCQSSSDDKTNSHVWKIYSEYLKAASSASSGPDSKEDSSNNGSADSRSGSGGYTLKMQEKINSEIDDNSFVKELLAGQEHFKGYSHSQWSKYHQFARFLAVLYPEYTYVHAYYESLRDHVEKKETELIQDEITKRVPFKEMELLIEKAGKSGDPKFVIEKKQVPDLNKLLTAMFYEATWFSGNNGSKDKLKGASKVHKDVPQLIHTFCDNYKVRCMKIHNGTKPVDRNDVLLFAFFFISYFVHLSSRTGGGKSGRAIEEKWSGIIENIEAIADQESVFDQVVLDVTEELRDPDNIKNDKYNTILKCLNLCLNGFGFVETYLPNPFDRFIVLSLLSENPMIVSAEVLECIRIEREND